jgi:hypothetical protein
LPIQTPFGSKSFANPNIRQIDSKTYVVSYFMPSEGNSPKEAGDAIYFVHF